MTVPQQPTPDEGQPAGQPAPADLPHVDQDGDDAKSEIDAKMAELLARGDDPKTISQARRALRETAQEGESADLLERFDALDFVDSVVGQPGSELPERLGEYRITDLLGRGGMGTVFEAFQESLERPVALKVLAPTLTSDDTMRRRFRKEARANATLHHQHIVPVYGFGETAGYLYFTMERVNGVSLDKHIVMRRTAGQFPDPRELARQFAGVAEALDHAHRRGILHRDVKPGNILVHPDGSFALADFGLSKMMNEASMSLSQAGGFLGTLSYAAPEQAKGHDPTPAGDLYALGVTMFEALTNTLPLDGKTTEAMLDALLNAEPKRLRDVMPKAPKDLDVVLDRLLQKNPADRYTDGEALARDLIRVADDEPVKIRRHSALIRAWRKVRKHPAMSSAIAAMVILVAVVLVQWRINVGAREQATDARFRDLLRFAENAANDESSDPVGPPGYLEALTGRSVPREVGSDTFFAHLRGAAQLRPDAEEPQKIADAYLSDPAPMGTRALLAGFGVQANRIFQEQITALQEQKKLSDDPTIELQLYRLYLGQAVAALTPAMNDRALASRHLVEASMQGNGAFLPRALTALVDWNREDGVDGLLAQLDGLLAGQSPRAFQAVGALLLASAGLDTPDSANFMDLGLAYGERRRLHERGTDYWGRGPDSDVLQEPSLVARLREIARAALDEMSAPSRLRAILATGRTLLTEQVAPKSPLQSWRLVFQLIEPPLQFNPSGDPRLLDMEVRALTDLVALGSDAVDLGRLWNRNSTWFDSLPRGRLDTSRLRALLAEAAGNRDKALAATQEWVGDDPENPEAYLCRMRCEAPSDAEAAGHAAVLAWQNAPDPDAMRERIVESLRQAAVDNPALDAIRRQFEGTGG